MKKSKKYLIVSVAATGLVVGGTLFANSVVANEEKSRPVFERVADILGLESDDLESAFDQAHDERIDQMLEEGKITEEQADKMKEMDFPRMGGMNSGMKGKMGFGNINELAEYLDIDKEVLHEEWEEAENLAEVIENHGKSPEEAKEYLKDVTTDKMNEALEEGKLTEDQVEKILENQDEMLDKLIYELAAPAGPRGGMRPDNMSFGERFEDK